MVEAVHALAKASESPMPFDSRIDYAERQNGGQEHSKFDISSDVEVKEYQQCLFFVIRCNQSNR